MTPRLRTSGDGKMEQPSMLRRRSLTFRSLGDELSLVTVQSEKVCQIFTS